MQLLVPVVLELMLQEVVMALMRGQLKVLVFIITVVIQRKTHRVRYGATQLILEQGLKHVLHCQSATHIGGRPTNASSLVLRTILLLFLHQAVLHQTYICGSTRILTISWTTSCQLILFCQQLFPILIHTRLLLQQVPWTPSLQTLTFMLQFK